MKKQTKSRKTFTGFTLIELLIVVAIIAILAAIAVPNFLEAQTRAKITREKNDLRVMATAIEAYYVDNATYPKDSDSSLDEKDVGIAAVTPGTPEFGLAANGAIYLTTPVAYITSLLTDPFAPPGTVLPSGGGAVGYRIASGAWSYSNPPINTSDNQGSHLVFPETGPIQAWAVIAVGPDGGRCRMGYKCFPFEPVNDPKEGPPSTNVNSKGQPFCWTEYDPTNGTTSVGDVYRFGGSYQEGRFMLNGAAVGRDTSPGPDAF